MIKAIIILVALWGYAATALFNAVLEDFKLYKLESKCVQQHIANGVERKDIRTSNGSCEIKTNSTKRL